MKESDIDHLLRQQGPNLPPPPGLKTRVCTTFRGTSRRKGFSAAWLLVPALVVMLMIHLAGRAPQTKSSRPTVPEVVTNPGPNSPFPASIGSAEEMVIGNLNEETEALRRTTRRTTRFLLDSLPHISLAD